MDDNAREHTGPADPDDRSGADDPDRNRRTGFTIRDAADEETEKGASRGFGRLLREVLVIVGIVLVLMFVFTQFLFRQYVVPSESMETTLHGCEGCTNDRILVDKLAYRFGDPEPGDVVVFKAPTTSWEEGWQSPRSSNEVVHKIQDVLSWFALSPPDENNLVKRVIATGGQTVQCTNADGKGVTVDGKPLDEPYIDKNLQVEQGEATDGVLGANGSSCYGADFGPIKVPDGNVWVMGDNRSSSADSRAHQEDELQGTVPVSDIRGKVRTILYPFSRFGGVGSHNPQG